MDIPVRYAKLWMLATLILDLPLTSPQQILSTDPIVAPHVYIREDSAIGTNVTTVRDGNANGPGKIVRIIYMGSNQAFYAQKSSRDASAWEIILNRTLDYETTTSMELTFEAQGGQNVLPTDVGFKLHIQDVNDNAPIFENQPYDASVNEDAVVDTVVYTISARDVDTGPGGAVSYQMVGAPGEYASKFVIDSSTGSVMLNGSLDYETTTFYHYKVIAKDRGIPSLSSATDLSITVKDVQDCPPVFTNLPYVASVPENTAVGFSVLTVEALDQHRAVPNTVVYSIVNTTCPGLFSVDAASGVISVASVSLDRDTSPLTDLLGLCTLSLKATEQTGSQPQKGPSTSEAVATIAVDDVNDNAPTFSRTSFTASLYENAPPGTPLQLDPGQHINVTDIDQSYNSEIQLSLSTSDDTFELVTSRFLSSGVVQLRVKNNTRLDFESTRSLICKVIARDDGPHHVPVTATVTLGILNVNEYSPMFSQYVYLTTVMENVPPGTSVIAIAAQDRDGGDFGRITYSLIGDQGRFRIDANSGLVIVTSEIDRERQDRYDMVVIARDGGGRQQTASLTVHILDVNDHAPVFSRNQYDVTVDKGATSVNPLLTIQAVDADEAGTDNSNMTYVISRTSPAGLASHFHLDPLSGQLSLTTPLDYDALQFPPDSAEIVKLTVVASDNSDPKQNAFAIVNVALYGISDHVSSGYQTTPHHSTSIPQDNAAALKVRLVNGSMWWEGRVEVQQAGTWGTVCDDGFGQKEASVVCRMLGVHSTTPRALHGGVYGGGTGPILLDEVRCLGWEQDLSLCHHDPWGVSDCTHSEDVGVACLSASRIRLVNGSSAASGRVEIFTDGQWGTVCDEDFDDNDAVVVCRMMELEGKENSRLPVTVHRGAWFGPGTGRVHYGNLECQGQEAHLDQCPHKVSSSCSHDNDVGVTCGQGGVAGPVIG